MKIHSLYGFFSLFLILLAACSTAHQTLPTGTIDPPAASATLPATLTPFLIVDPAPSSTPVPSPTPVPPTATSAAAPTQPPEISLVFTGAIVPARCVQASIDEKGQADYLYDEIRDLLVGADLTVGTLNASISDYPPKTGCVQTFVLVSDPRNATAMQNAGIDVVSIATNHIKNCGLGDCGDRAFLDTLDNLRKVKIQPVGAGRTLAEAMQPVVVEAQGVRFGIVSLGMVDSWMLYAGEDTPGVAKLTEENLKAAIEAAKQVSDVVIFMPHWGSDYGADPNWWQLHFANLAVEEGADLVVGNHAHVVQAYQEIEGVPVFYALGSLVFDQTWSRETQQGVILKVTYSGTTLDGWELIPTHTDGDGTVHLAGPEEAQEILDRMEAASEKLSSTSP